MFVSGDGSMVSASGLVPLCGDLARKTVCFGKHRGKTFENVFEEDKAYVRWVVGIHSPSTTAMCDLQRYLKFRAAGGAPAAVIEKGVQLALGNKALARTISAPLIFDLETELRRAREPRAVFRLLDAHTSAVGSSRALCSMAQARVFESCKHYTCTIPRGALSLGLVDISIA